MRHKMIWLLGMALAVMLGITGCTSTSQILPKVAEDTPPSDKALIIVEGSSSFSGIYKLYAVKVYDGTTLVGSLGPHGRLVWLRDPGPVSISIVGANGRRHTVAGGETYRYKVECPAGSPYSLAGPGVAFRY